MIKGICYTPTQVGRITIGEIVETNGKRLPKKNDHITITGMNQNGARWEGHRIVEKLREGMAAEEKLRRIPVRIMFDTVENNLRAEYTSFDNKGRPLCAGDGEKARRRDVSGKVEDVDCPGSDTCAYGKDTRCKLFGRLIIGIEGAFQENPLAGFMFRTTSWNSIKQLKSSLEYLHAISSGKMAGMAVDLVMRSKTTSASMRKPIYYLDLIAANGLEKAVQSAIEFQSTWDSAGLNRGALEKAVSDGYNNSSFFEDSTDGEDVVAEFAMGPDGDVDTETGEVAPSSTQSFNPVTNKPEAPQNAKSSAAEAQKAEAAPEFKISPAQIEEIATWLQNTGKSVSSLNAWLSRPDTPLNTLTEAETNKALMSARKSTASASIPQTSTSSHAQAPVSQAVTPQPAQTAPQVQPVPRTTPPPASYLDF